MGGNFFFTNTFSVCTLLATMTLSGCGGSVLFYNKKTPNAPSLNQNNPRTQSTDPQIMKFLPLRGDSTLDSRGGALGLIYGDGMVDPFEVNNAQQSLSIDMKVRSEEIDERSFENFIKARFKISFQIGTRPATVRDFESDGLISLKNVGSQDVMSGTFKDVDSGRVRISISARRNASSTADQAARNPWKGTLQLLENDNRLTNLGSVDGYFSGLLPQ